jgi:hypothetical protein
VELFEQIRRAYDDGVGTIQGVARQFGVHRRLVREALRSAVPTERPASTRARPRIAPVTAFVDAILAADQRAPRKQRHTAHRIYGRIRAELPDCSIAESTVRRHVRERKDALVQLRREIFVPQSYAWGSEGQVDWYEADADVDGARETLQVFVLRGMASGGAFHRAYRRTTQQAFLDAHELAFRYFGGYVGHRCQETSSLRRASRPSKMRWRPSWPLAAASSRCFSSVGRNSTVVWKNVQDSQIDSKWQSSSTGRAQ